MGARSWAVATRAILRVPVFYKILLGNLAIVTAAMATTFWLSRVTWAPAETGLPGAAVWPALGIGVLLLSLGVNGLLVRIALSPLTELEDTVAEVSAGNPARRASVSPLADRDLARVIGSFNDMLDRSAAYRERLRELSARFLRVQEDERRRIARELHDDTAQRMVTVALRLGFARKRLKGHPAADQIDEAHGALLDTVEGLRRIARGLRPPALDELGLFAAVEVHAREMRERSSIQVEVERREASGARRRPLSPQSELAAYRIIQEALSNAQRHAGARHVKVTFEDRNDALRITIEDDGCGFDPAEKVAGGDEGGLGLLGMEERAAHVGGHVEIDSSPGRGARVAVAFPWPAAEDELLNAEMEAMGA